MFDITSLQIADTATYHVTDAKGTPQYDGETPITITIHSPGVKKASAAKFALEKKRSERVFTKMSGKDDGMTEADERRERAVFLAEITASLNGFEYKGGAAELYANPRLQHIANGVEKLFGDLGNFAPSSATELPSS